MKEGEREIAKAVPTVPGCNAAICITLHCRRLHHRKLNGRIVNARGL